MISVVLFGTMATAVSNEYVLSIYALFLAHLLTTSLGGVQAISTPILQELSDTRICALGPHRTTQSGF